MLVGGCGDGGGTGGSGRLDGGRVVVGSDGSVVLVGAEVSSAGPVAEVPGTTDPGTGVPVRVPGAGASSGGGPALGEVG